MNNLNQNLTNDEAAEYLRVSPATLDVWRCTRRYALPYTRAGRRILYRLSDLEHFLNQRTVAEAAEATK